MRIRYGFNDVPKTYESIILAFQHVLAAIGGIITVPLAIGAAIGLPPIDISILVSAAFIASGIGTLIQCIGIGPVGAKVPGLMGSEIEFLAPSIEVGKYYGLPGIFGGIIAGSFFEILLSRMLKYLGKLFSPVVRGTLILIVGLTFMPIGIRWISGSSAELGIAFMVIALIIILNTFGKGIVSSGAILFSMLIGYAIAFAGGFVGHINVLERGIIAFPKPLSYGITFNPAAIIPFAVVYVISMIEMVGSLFAIGEACNEDMSMERIANGVLADGVTSTIAGFLNSMPLTTFNQNIGIIALTGVASKRVITISGIILIAFGLFPPLGSIFGAIPQAVLGGAVLVMFGMVSATGIGILKNVEMNNRNMLIISVSVSLAVGVSSFPEVFSSLPTWAQMIFSSGLVTGCIASILMNYILPEEKDAA